MAVLTEHRVRQEGSRQENDFYATLPEDVRLIMNLENIRGLTILEPCAGLGDMAEELRKDNTVITNELMRYGYTCDYHEDFLQLPRIEGIDAVVMNPPYKISEKFITKAFEYADKVYVFQKLSFLAGQKRGVSLYSKKWLEKVYVYSYRTFCAKNGDFEKYNAGAIDYAWFVFNKKNTEDTVIKWIQKEE